MATSQNGTDRPPRKRKPKKRELGGKKPTKGYRAMGEEPVDDPSYHGLGAPAAPEVEYDYNSPTNVVRRKPQALWNRDDFETIKAERAQRGQPVPVPTGGVPPAGAPSGDSWAASVLPTLTGLTSFGARGEPIQEAPQGGGGLPAGSPAAPSGRSRYSPGFWPATTDAYLQYLDFWKDKVAEPVAGALFGPSGREWVTNVGDKAVGWLGRNVLDRDGTMMPSLGYGPPQVDPGDVVTRGVNVKPGDPLSADPASHNVPALPPLRHPLDLPGGVAQPTYVMDNDGTRMLLPQVGVPPLQPAGNFLEQSGAVPPRDGAGVTREQQEESLAKLHRILTAPGANFPSLGIDNPQLPPGADFAPTPEQVAFGHNASRIANRISSADPRPNLRPFTPADHDRNMEQMRRPGDTIAEDRARRGPTGDAADVLAHELRMAGMKGAGVSDGYSGGVGLGGSRSGWGRKGDPNGPYYSYTDKNVTDEIKQHKTWLDNTSGTELKGDKAKKKYHDVEIKIAELEAVKVARNNWDVNQGLGHTDNSNSRPYYFEKDRNKIYVLKPGEEFPPDAIELPQSS